MRKRTGRQQGFTLIELMIVIAIIAILAAVAMPSYIRSRDRALFSQCLETLTDVKLAEEMYITNNRSYVTDTSDIDRLAVYMIPGCVKPDGSDCKGRVAATIERNCRSKNDNPPGTWMISWGPSSSYYIQGTSKDRTRCGICVTPSGYRPTSYRDTCMRIYRSPPDCTQ